MSLTFNAIDVETANCDRASICQIGIVHVDSGEIRDCWKSLINPEDWFDPWNIDIHGITSQHVKNAPILPEVRSELRSRLRGSVLVSHTAFDRVAFERAMRKYGLEQLQVTWLDSAMIVRRAWPEKYARSGYGLGNVARDLGVSFRAHDALEDARAAAEIVLAASRATGTDVRGWLERVKRGIGDNVGKPRGSRVGSLDGPLYGETVVFTGSLGIPRRNAADLAAEAGCNVQDNVTKRVTMLVVGVQDRTRLRGYTKSRKHRQVEELNEKGFGIEILSEQDFMDVLHTN